MMGGVLGRVLVAKGAPDVLVLLIVERKCIARTIPIVVTLTFSWYRYLRPTGVTVVPV